VVNSPEGLGNGIAMLQWVETSAGVMGDLRTIFRDPDDPNATVIQGFVIHLTGRRAADGSYELQWYLPGTTDNSPKLIAAMEAGSWRLKSIDQQAPMLWTMTPGSVAQYDQAVAQYSKESLATAFLVKQELSDVGDGWQYIKVTVGIRNLAPQLTNVDPTQFPGKPSVEIAGVNKSYGLDSVPVYHVRYNVPLPGGFAFCGIGDSFLLHYSVSYLQYQGKIPQQTKPAVFSIPGLLPADISGAPAPDLCKPQHLDSLPRLPVEVPIGEGQKPDAIFRLKDLNAVPAKSNSGGGDQNAIVIHAEIENLNKLDNYKVLGLQVWLFDDDGVVRPMLSDPYGLPEEADCPGRVLIPTIGPGQTLPVSLCYISRPNKVAAVVIQYMEGLATVVRP
jgi:hypothetical protein